jgi:superfamily II DNA or RNA helicase
MNRPTIIDNYKHGKLKEFLIDVISPNSEVSIVSAYFTIHAYNSLKSNLDKIKNLKFLFGEPTFIKSVNPDTLEPREYKFEDDKLLISSETQLLQKSIAKECYKWLNEKSEIRSIVKPNFLHGKMYHVKQENGVEKAISGSSNFTSHGLGSESDNRNIELNMIIDNDRDREELKEWFDSIWNDNSGIVEDVKDKVLNYLQQLYSENSPEFIYYKTLYHIFSNYLKEQKENTVIDENTGFYESQIWDSLYDFQKDGVKGAINKILKHSGCIIADSVGLGKTYEALAVIKYFELHNDTVLVICPKKLSNNWTIYQASQNNILNPFKKDRFNYQVLYHTDMARCFGISGANGIDLETFNWNAYKLVIIDESHNFRGNPVTKETGDSIKFNRAAWLMEKIIKSGAKTKVLMLSATPVNNSLRDLRNQIAFITEGKDSALIESCGIKSIDQTLKNAQTKFTRWASPKNQSRNKTSLLGELDPSFFTLLDELTIARSRKHIIDFYNIAAIGQFPTREKPLSIYPNIDTNEYFPSYDNINKQILEYKLSMFNPSSYVKPEKQSDYETLYKGQVQFKQSDRESYLIAMMKVNFLKRLESSISSFAISLERTIKKTENLLKKIEDFNSLSIKESSTIDEVEPDEEETEDYADEDETWKVGKGLKFEMKDLNLDEWRSDLKKDKDALISLLNNARAIDPQRDAKLQELKQLIKNKVENPFNNDNKKIVVFTAFADTAKYLYENLSVWILKEFNLHSALVCGSYTQATYGKNDFSSILINFSPLSKNRDKIDAIKKDNEISILFATDCISEGQNLQDCDYLINYDIHWNPVRIIQRFGRIDRIGSHNRIIKLVNFWPTKDLENYINLKTRVEARMALVDITATAEDNLLTSDQVQELISEDLKYRNKQLIRLQNEILDLEDLDTAISLTDFSMDDFKIELGKYIDSNKQKLKDSPLGLYAIVPPNPKYETIKSGVIYCLAQKTFSADNTSVNPLNPYFLIYVCNDGTIRYNYTNAKRILEIFRQLCQGKQSPYEELCNIFNKETVNGSDMSQYTRLLLKSVEEIIRVFNKKETANLTSSRDGIIIPTENRVSNTGDFELITWLVIK